MGFMQRQCGIVDDLDFMMKTQAGPRRIQRSSGDELHRDVGFAVDLADFVDPADVGMIEPGAVAPRSRMLFT
jgi:hypothetical protein